MADAGGEEPTGWELLRAIHVERQDTADDIANLRDRVIALEGQKQDSANFRRAIVIAVASAIVAAVGSLAVSLVLHFAFT
jgi:hypothetical protein